LLPRPTCRRMLRHVEVNHTPAVMNQHHQDKQHPKRSSRNREEIDGNQLRYVIVEECFPGLRTGSHTSSDESRDGPFRDMIPSFSNSPWILGAPQSGFAAAIFSIKSRIS